MSELKQALALACLIFLAWAWDHFFRWPHAIYVRSCHCGAHWYIRRWFFVWRHLDASPFNDRLQDRWTIWTFEFRNVLKLTAKEQAAMGYPNGPWWPLGSGKLQGKPMWANSAWQLSPFSKSYCARCGPLKL